MTCVHCVGRYVIWWNKGYQEFDKVVSATTTKVKGIAVTNCTELNITVPGGVNGTRIWDVADYVVPPQVCGFDYLLRWVTYRLIT